MHIRPIVTTAWCRYRRLNARSCVSLGAQLSNLTTLSSRIFHQNLYSWTPCLVILSFTPVTRSFIGRKRTGSQLFVGGRKLVAPKTAVRLNSCSSSTAFNCTFGRSTMSNAPHPPASRRLLRRRSSSCSRN